jgi:hypothetical protein
MGTRLLCPAIYLFLEHAACGGNAQIPSWAKYPPVSPIRPIRVQMEARLQTKSQMFSNLKYSRRSSLLVPVLSYSYPTVGWLSNSQLEALQTSVVWPTQQLTNVVYKE